MPRRRWSTTQYLECKTWGHAWDEFDTTRTPKERYTYRMTLRCSRCYTERFDYLDTDASVMRRTYFYSNGYRDAKGSEKPTRSEMRLIIIKRKTRK